MSEQIDIALRWGTEKIQPASETANLDAEILLAHCLDKPRSFLYAWPETVLSSACWAQFQALVTRRLEPTPVAYLIGSREFFSLEFATTPVALVPRPETELTVEIALANIPTNQPFKVCDLGTGSGVIAITVKSQRPLSQVCATDIDTGCLELARRNAARHQADIEFILSDWLQNIAAGRRFDLIVANPPYVAADHPFLSLGDLPAEPTHALSPGTTGLEALQTIISQASHFLNPGGHLVLEHGYDQQAAVADLFKRHGFAAARCAADHNNLPRTSCAKRLENINSGA